MNQTTSKRSSLDFFNWWGGDENKIKVTWILVAAVRSIIRCSGILIPASSHLFRFRRHAAPLHSIHPSVDRERDVRKRNCLSLIHKSRKSCREVGWVFQKLYKSKCMGIDKKPTELITKPYQVFSKTDNPLLAGRPQTHRMREREDAIIKTMAPIWRS